MLSNRNYRNFERIIDCGLSGLEEGTNSKETVQENILCYARENFSSRNRVRAFGVKLLQAAVLIAAGILFLVSLGFVFLAMVMYGIPSWMALLMEATILADIIVRLSNKRRIKKYGKKKDC